MSFDIVLVGITGDTTKQIYIQKTCDTVEKLVWSIGATGLLVALVIEHFALHSSQVLQCVTAFAAIVPIAKLMGDVTERLADVVGPQLGGFLNGTFGNAVELILALVALSKGEIELVKYTLTGSILSNLLLVLGGAVLFGCVAQKQDLKFSQSGAQTDSTVMQLAISGFLLPTIFSVTAPEAGEIPIQDLSVAAALVLLAVYFGRLFFVMFTHKDFLATENGHGQADMEEDSEGTGGWLLPTALLLALSLVVAFESEVLVTNLEATTEALHWSPLFVGVILLPIVGNAAEHWSAVKGAMAGKMALALEVASGSSLQIATVVGPLLVVAGFIVKQPMDLAFSWIQLAAIAIPVALVSSVSQDGKVNWLEGLALLGCYIIVAAGFFFYPV